MSVGQGDAKTAAQQKRADKGRDRSNQTTSPELPRLAQFHPRSSARTLVVMILTIQLVSVAVYFNALFNGFVYDDQFQVVNNLWLRDISHVPEMFSGNTWGFSGMISNYYRPLMHLLYMAAYHLFGPAAWGFHLMNVLFHGGNSVLVFIIASRLIGNPEEKVKVKAEAEEKSFSVLTSTSTSAFLSPPFIAALLFAAHPIHTEAVTWVAGLPEVSFTFFSLLSFYFAIESGERAGHRILLSVVFFALAALCKETALVMPVVFLIYDVSFGKNSRGIPALMKRYIPYIAVITVYLLARVLVLGGFAPGSGHVDFRGKLSAYRYVINVFPLFILYLKQLLLPVDLRAWYVFHPVDSLREIGGMAACIASMAFAALWGLAWKKDRPVFFGLSLVVVPLLPVFYIPAIAVPFAERYLYLPSFGYVLLLAILTGRASRRRAQALRLAALLFAVIIFYALGTVHRNTVWRDNDAFWTDAVRKSPDSYMPHYNLGVELWGRGRTDGAIEQFRAALRINPGFVYARSNLGAAYMRKGMIDEAVKELRIAVALDPGYADAHNNLGSALGEKGLSAEAMEQFRTSLSLRPDFADAHNNLGISYLKSGDFEKALFHFEAAVRLDPHHPEYRSNLAGAYEIKRLRERFRQKDEGDGKPEGEGKTRPW